MITKLKDFNPSITKVSWNYQESGHGKGAPDGIGAVVKRTADNFVRYGGDVGYFEDFWSLVTQNIPNVHFEMITENEIKGKTFPPNLPGFKGTMKAHQVVWAADHKKTIVFRELSCFECENISNVCNHNKHLGFLHCDSFGEIETDTLVTQHEQNEYPNDNVSVLSLGTSTILNNLDDSDVYKNLQTLRDPIDLQLSPLVNDEVPSTSTQAPKVKILSDVRLTWENSKFYKIPEVGANYEHQRQFEKFIQSNNFDKTSNKYDDFESDSDDYNIF